MVPMDEPVVGGLIDRKLGALPFVKIGLRSPPNRSPNPNVVGEGEFWVRSGVLVPRVLWRESVSIRDKAEDC